MTMVDINAHSTIQRLIKQAIESQTNINEQNINGASLKDIQSTQKKLTELILKMEDKLRKLKVARDYVAGSIVPEAKKSHDDLNFQISQTSDTLNALKDLMYSHTQRNSLLA